MYSICKENVASPPCYNNRLHDGGVGVKSGIRVQVRVVNTCPVVEMIIIDMEFYLYHLIILWAPSRRERLLCSLCNLILYHYAEC